MRTWAGLGLVMLFACTGEAESTGTPPPNIIIVLADDLGYGDPQCYNPKSPIPTPNMDRLAKEGMRFTDAHSAAAVCTPSRYALLTGRYSWRGSLKESVLWGYSPSLIEPGRKTIATLCKEAGYHTMAVGKWHLGLGTEKRADYSAPLRPSPLDFGFDHFFGIPASLDMDPYVMFEDDHALVPPTEKIDANDPSGPGYWRRGPIAPGFDHRQVLPDLQSRALQFVRSRATARDARPFFLYFPLTSPHTPCLPTAEFKGKTSVGDYGDFVLQTDAVLGSLLELMDETGIANRTMIVFTSDNGAHEGVLPDGCTHDPNLPLRGQKADIWEGGHRVPFLVRWPGVVPAGATCAATCGQVDLFATVRDLLGQSATEDAGEDSLSLLPLLKGEAWKPEARSVLIHHSSHGMFAARSGSWKLIEGVNGGGFGWDEKKDIPGPGVPGGQLYDLAADPGESRNLFETEPEKVAELTGLLNRARDSGRTVPVN